MTALRFGNLKVSAEEITQERFLRSKEGHRGHPTVPGDRDPWMRRRGGPSPGNGVPAVPRYTALADYYPGILRGSGGPRNPGVAYDNPLGEDRGDT